MCAAGLRALVIDARPRGPHGPLAAERVLGRSVLTHLVDAAATIAAGPISIHARFDEHEALHKLVGDNVIFRTGPPPESASILRADRLYDQRRLRRVLQAGKDPEKAVIWRLDRPNALEAAAAELLRRETYQPLGRHWALAPAKKLAELLAPTRIRPNAVTLAAAALMLGSAALVAFGSINWFSRILVGFMLALALILDTADGHLARLQGTATDFGRWLDALLDELADMALHAAIAFGLFLQTGQPAWMGVGMLYAMGKYVFVMAQQDSDSAVEGPTLSIATPSIAKRVVRMIGHADVRWHLWIGLALIGKLEWALIAYAAYFPVRTAGIVVRKAVAHG
jgi:hypothetical protein